MTAAKRERSVSPWGRLKVGNRYVWVYFPSYSGPSFFTDANMSKVYEPADESDPVWPEFSKWLGKHQATKAKAAVQRLLRAKEQTQ